jgi:hypothetical protein
MHHLYRHHLQIAYLQWLMGMDLVQSYRRHTWIAILSETIRQHLQHRLLGYRVGINVYRSKLTVRTYIVHSAHVVVVRVGYQYTVYLAERLW